MDEILYLEADEEITSVVDKLKGLEADSVRLVVPNGSTIAQSLVSLKLLKKQAKELDKQIAIVTSDEVGRNLASQIDLPVFSDVKSAKAIVTQNAQEKAIVEPIEINMDEKNSETGSDLKKIDEKTGEAEEQGDLPKDFKVRRYDDEAKGDVEEEPVQKSPELKEVEEDAPSHEIDSSFVARPVGEIKNHSERMELESARPIRAEDHVVKSKGKFNWRRFAKVSAASILLVAIILVADISIVKINVNLKVVADEIEKQATIKVEKDRPAVDLENSIIPGFQIVQENPIEQEFNTTGEKDAGEKSKGTLTLKNESGVDEQIAAGTTVTSSGGVGFTLNAVATVPKAQLNQAGDKVLGQADGAIVAKDNGTQGNLPAATTYIISGHSKISASGATSGGITKIIKTVAKADIDKAKKALQDQKLDTTSIKGIAENQTVLDGASMSEITDFTTSKNAGDEADKFSAKVLMKYTAISYNNDQFREAIIGSIEKTLPEGKGLLITDSDIIAPTLKDAQINIGTIQVEGSLKTHIGPKLDVAKLIESWKLRPTSKIRKTLSGVEGVTISSIDRTPKYTLPLAPLVKKNIKVNLEYTKK